MYRLSDSAQWCEQQDAEDQDPEVEHPEHQGDEHAVGEDPHSAARVLAERAPIPLRPAAARAEMRESERSARKTKALASTNAPQKPEVDSTGYPRGRRDPRSGGRRSPRPSPGPRQRPPSGSAEPSPDPFGRPRQDRTGQTVSGRALPGAAARNGSHLRRIGGPAAGDQPSIRRGAMLHCRTLS